MHGVRLAQGERRDAGGERLAAGRNHVVGAFHHPERRGQRAARRVGERFVGCEHGLLADDAGALDFFHLTRPAQWVKNVFVLAPMFFHKDLVSAAPNGDPACSSRNTVNAVSGGRPRASTEKESKPI